MILWLLLTICGAYFLAAEPHLAGRRKKLAERSALFRELIRCPPCCYGWASLVVEAVVRTGVFVPGWLRSSLPCVAVEAITPVLAAAAGIGLGALMVTLSPLTAALAGRSKDAP